MPVLRRLATAIVPPAIVVALVLLVWELACRQAGAGLPPPSTVLRDTWELIIDPFFDRGGIDKGLFWHISASLQRVALGYALAALGGIALGVLVGQSAWAMRGLDPLFQVLRTVPPLAWLPLSLAAFRDGQPSAIFVIFITAIWPIIINTAVGIRNIPQDYRNVAAVLRLNSFEFFAKIMLPAAAPYIFTGLRIGIGLSWLAIVAAEMLIGGVGIGFFIWDAWNSSRISDIILALVYVGLIGFVLDRVVAFVGRFRHPRHERAMRGGGMAYLQIDHVDISFSRGGVTTEVLRDVNLRIEPGEFVSIIGHSGCGKSTLLNIVAGLLRASLGGVLLEDREVNAPGPDRAVVFQNHSLLPWLTVYENVGLAVDKVFGARKSRAERHEWIDAQSRASCSMAHAADKRPSEISGGMKQRVGIARALAMEPKVLLLDEPFGALDALTRAHLQDQVMEIHARLGNTVIMITHDVDEAVLLSDRIVMMTNGPAATIGEVLKVGLPRPRKRLELVDDHTYIHARAAVLEFLYARHAAPALAA